MAYHPEDDANFCATCGREQEPGARFCPNCGAAADPLAAGGGPRYAPGMANPAGGSMSGGVEYMGFWIRVAAALIDAILIIVTNLLLILLWGLLLERTFASFGQVGFGLGGVAFLIIWVAIPWIYHVAFITSKGQTIGKMIVGAQVVNRDGNIPRLGSVLLREIVGKFLSRLALNLGYLWVGWDKEKRGWHDHIGGTYVVRKRRG